jgi:hypothetical protein
MRFVKRLRPSPAMVVAMLSLIVALGGVGYAASLPRNSVGKSQLKSRAVTSAKLANNAVTRSKIRNDAVNGDKVAADSLTGADILESSLGTVPSATNATNATNAANATNATHAANASTLDGIGSGGFVHVKTRVFEAASILSVANYADDATLLQVSDLPGGQYVISAKLQVDNDTAATDELVDCDLLAGGVQLDTQDQRLGGANDPADELGYALIGTFTASSAGTDDVLIRCGQVGADNDTDNMHIIATLINN